MQRIWILCIALMTFQGVYAQKVYTVEEYIDEYKAIAIDQMNKVGIPASIILAQGILESRYGNSTLSVASNNHFGIKCHTGWTGKSYYHDDDKKNECFRVYDNPEQSFRDHSEFLTTRSRYDFLFSYGSTDYENWAHGLKKAGYATNPKYGEILIGLIERHQLYLYDRPGRDLIASDSHENRNNHEKVNGQKDFKMTDNQAQSQDQVESAGMSNVISYNRIKAVVVSRYDNIYQIANRYEVPANRILKYNDLTAGQDLEVGQVLYLQPKRSKARTRNHVVQEDETMWDISQLHGVKLDKLYQRNMLSAGEEPAPGSILSLNTKSDTKPSVRIFRPTPAPVEKKEAPAATTTVAAKPVPKETATETVKAAVREEVAPAPKKEVEATVAVPAEKKVVEEKKEEVPAIDSSWKKIHEVLKGETLYSISRLHGVKVDEIKTWNNLNDNIISIGQKLIVSP